MSVVVGVDEVGRGSWAGPLVAGAVILNKPIKGLKDSKKLTKLQRERFAETINKKALAVGLGWVSPKQIDELGLTAAVRLAMIKAVRQITAEYSAIIIDGKYNFLSHLSTSKAVIKADSSVACVSAAGIVAKVARDNYMAKIAKKYPAYGFESHVGYGTRLHNNALKAHGVCKIHRLSYKPIKTLIISL